MILIAARVGQKCPWYFSAEKTCILSNYLIPIQSAPVMDDDVVAVCSVDSTTNLGVELNADLYIKTHFARILKKNWSTCQSTMTYEITPQCPNHLPFLCKSHIRRTIEYAVPVWSCRLPAKLLDMLNVLQANVCRRFLKCAGITF